MALSIIKHCIHIRSLNNATTISFRFSSKYNASLISRNKFNANSTEELGDMIDVDVPGTNLSRQMKSYIKQTKDYENFMKKEITEYEIGLRHLSNIMGVDIETIKKEGTKKYIEYLFPSGLYDKKARPVFEHPSILFPPKKEVEFNLTGRPYHAFFYTIKPNYYKFLHDAAQVFQSLENIKTESYMMHSEQNLQSTQRETDPNSVQQVVPISHDEVQVLLDEKLSDVEYEYFVNTVKRLVDHQYKTKAQKFLQPYVCIKKHEDLKIQVHPIELDDKGRMYVKIENCTRKSSKGTVTVYKNGDGKITINGQNILYFKEVHLREQIAFPLIFTGMGNEVDIVAEVQGGGPAGQSGAIRWGISQALLSFVDDKMKHKMRNAGLLTRDRRRRERKKIGKQGARRSFTWKKR